VTIWRDARAPFRSPHEFHPAKLAERADARAPHHSARSNPSFGGDGPPSSASAVSTACSELGRPSTACLSTRREARPRCVPTDFCFPLLRLRAPAPRRFPASLRSFHFALGRWACTQDQETGGLSVSRRSIRFGGPPGLAHGVLLHALPTEPCLWHPCRAPICRRCAFARAGLLGDAETASADPPWRWGQPLQSEAPSIDEDCPRSCASWYQSRVAVTWWVSASIRPSTSFRPQSLRCAEAPACWLRSRLPSPYAL